MTDGWRNIQIWEGSHCLFVVETNLYPFHGPFASVQVIMALSPSWLKEERISTGGLNLPRPPPQTIAGNATAMRKGRERKLDQSAPRDEPPNGLNVRLISVNGPFPM